ncbi:hypothetical protein [Burkholderia plantarii]|uniref:hypothetical protein n=1 Tax=Burkholderia plantarii TaxID=41899 RepID=UPI00114D2F44|nr:hypothetical protein [Burkholderia plantarii]
MCIRDRRWTADHTGRESFHDRQHAVAAIAVSYTHQMCIRDRSIKIDGKFRFLRWTGLCLARYLYPVSYTHLDVYKRQALDS